MPDSQPRTASSPFRLAFSPDGRSTNVQWLDADHPANILLDVGHPPSLPTGWAFLNSFGLRDVMLHRRNFVRQVQCDGVHVVAHLTLISDTNAAILVCTSFNAFLSENDCAVLGGICLLASGGLGTTLEAVATVARQQTKEVAIEERAQADADTTRPLFDTIMKAIMPSSAKVSLTPSRFDGGPADLNIGSLSLRVFDRESFAFAGMLAAVATTLQTSVRKLIGGDRG